MNKTKATIWAGLILLLLAVGSVAWRLSARPEEPVALRFRGYHWVARENWCFAQMDLINRSTNQVRFPIFRNDELRLSPTVSRQTRWASWSSDEIPPSAPNAISEVHTLQPGTTITLRVLVTPENKKRTVGILLGDVPAKVRHPLELRLRRVLQPLSVSLGIPITPPEALAFWDGLIWCETPMDPPQKPPEKGPR